MRIRFKNGLVRNVPQARARALIRTGAATRVDGVYQTRDMRAAPGSRPEPPAADLQQLRDDYQSLYGKRPFMGWKEDVLRQKIDEALNA